MKTLYIDCTNGVSGDMVLRALCDLAGTDGTTAPLVGVHEHHHEHHHDHDHEHHHGRSYAEVQTIIDGQEQFTAKARQTARDIYAVIAKAEASVHEKTLETVHFHEVGRDQAIANALGIGAALDIIRPDRILVSKINDGSGFVDCAHGRIPVPVPAVQAMMDECGTVYPALKFNTCTDVDTEMVTPSGLAAVIGMGAVPADSGMMFMEGQITSETEAKGTRDTGRGGLRMYIIEK